LKEGEFLIIEGDKYVNRNMYVSTNNKDDKIFAYQGLGDVYQGFGGQYPAANQGMVFVPPLSCGTSGNVNNIADIDKVGEGNGSTFNDTAQVSFVTTKGSTVFVNGAQLNEANNNVTRNDVLGNNNYESYIVTNLSGNIRIESNGEMYVSYYNTDGAASTAGFYSGFTKPPKFDITSEFQAKGNCVNEDGSSNIVLTAEGSFTSYLWEIKNNDGTFRPAPGNSTATTYTPTESGTYRLKGILECDIELNSDEIPISICATDSDNDGIIDNIDLDLDNDGILNSKTINIEVENIDSTNLEILFVHRLYGDSSSQINSPSISMLGSERFIEMNSATYFGSYMLNSDVVTLIQENNSIQVNVNINENLPDNLLVVPINRRGFQDLNPEKKVELEAAKNREQLSVTWNYSCIN